MSKPHIFGWEQPWAIPNVDFDLAMAIMRITAPKHTRLYAAQCREVADAYGVSLRTVYRWRAAMTGIVEVRVDGWRALYAVRRAQQPVRISNWYRGRGRPPIHGSVKTIASPRPTPTERAA